MSSELISDTRPIVVTGASGLLGRLTLHELAARGADGRIIGLVRNEKAARDLQHKGIATRFADYNDRASFVAALQGAGQVLFISSSEVGQRVQQHANVIEAAKEAGVSRIAYTSVLRADTNPMQLAHDHRETERLIRASGIPFVFLRNGWYTENYTQAIGPALQHGAIIGSAGEGKLATASRADYAAAAAAALLHSGAGDAVFELAGDQAYTLAQLASEVSRQAGKAVIYKNLPVEAYASILASHGLPSAVAAVIADSDLHASAGALFDDSHTLSRLIGRPTTPMPETVAAALARLA